MIFASGFSWFMPLPQLLGLPAGDDPAWFHGHLYLFYTAWFVCAVLVAFAIVARGQLKKAMERQGLERYHADETLTARSSAEIFVGGVMGMMSDLMDRDNVARFLPLIGGLFAYIMVSNLLALLPGFQPPTDNINTNIGMAVIVMLSYWAVGLLMGGKDFIGHITGPVLALAPLMMLIELISLLAVRPGSLAVRLTGNIFGDHTVYNIMSGLVPLLVPTIFLALALLVSIIQAFVFSLLTTIYLSQSLPHGDHDDHH